MDACSSELRVAHLDCDAFYVSVELLRRPHLRGQPVIVAGEGPRAVVTTASYEARRCGVGSAMPASRARRLCPHATFLPPDFSYYREVSRRMFATIASHVERIETVGLDEAYLDVADLRAPKAAMRRIVADIESEVGLGCSVGIGPNKLVAKVASDVEKPSGFVALTAEQARERFAASPPRLLPGIGPKTAARLAELRISTLAQLRAAPVELLMEQFGANHGRYLSARARFEDDSEISGARIAASESRERTFDVDIFDLQEMAGHLRAMSFALCASLAKHQRVGRTVSIKVRLADFSTVTRSRTLSQATGDPRTVAAIALELLRTNRPTKPVRLLGVRVSGFQPTGGRAEEGGAHARQAAAIAQPRQLSLWR